MASNTHPTNPVTPKPTISDRYASRRDRVAPIVAIAILAFFAMVLLYLLRQIDLPQQQWDRMIFLLNGVEAIAFAAAGYLFGKEVNRQRAEKAEQQAAEAADDASNGRVLATLVKTKAVRMNRSGGLESVRPNNVADLQELGEIAERLFPAA